jgi:polyisoprenoid-binding protein YceI
MKKISIVAAFLLASAVSSFAQTTWTADPVHSGLGFSILHMGINDFNGSFNTYTATITASKADFSDATYAVSVDVASINTGNDQRNGHLKSADFFEADKFNTATFKSTSVKKTGAKTFKVTGDLTLHGVTKPITLDVVYNGSTTNPMSKKEIAGFKITGSFKRSDFNFAPGMTPPMLGDVVTINANGEFIKG